MNIQSAHPRPSFWNTVGIVAKREIVVRCLSKSFLISTFITMAIFLALMVFAPQLGKLMTGDSTVAASGQIATALEKIPDLTVKEVADDAAARELTASGEVTAAVVADPTNPTGMKVVVEKDLPTSLLNTLSVTPEVEILNPNAPHPGILYMLRLGFGMVWMMAAITFGMSIAQSVVEEKQTRIVEILVASVSSKALLTGKILGNSIAAMAQIVLIIATVVLGASINGDVIPLGKLAGPIGWFTILFLFGFVMIASLYAAAAALASRTEDLNNTVQPLIWLVMLPYFGVIFAGTNQVAMQVMALFPLTSAVATPIRIFQGDSPVWEPFAAMVILIATTVAVIVLAGKIYDRGLLQTGKPMKWREALKAEA